MLAHKHVLFFFVVFRVSQATKQHHEVQAILIHWQLNIFSIIIVVLQREHDFYHCANVSLITETLNVNYLM